jgi:hypothetical protein
LRPRPSFGVGLSDPTELQQITNKCLEKDRNLRYQHASEVRTDLQRLKRDHQSGHRAEGGSGTVAMPEAPPTQVRQLWKIAVPVLLVTMLAASGIYYRSRRSKPLTDRDTIVIADFANRTGDVVFDDTLKQALSVALNQSPFLNVLSENKVAVGMDGFSHTGETGARFKIASKITPVLSP